jgi:uncharacterized protein YggE
MMRALLLIVVDAVIAAAMLPALAFGETSEIAVTGYGMAAAKPDYATIEIPISVLRGKAEEATQAAAMRYDSLISTLGRLGIGEDDYSTMQYRVSPEWERDDRGRQGKFRGYAAMHRLRVRVRDLVMVGRILDAAVGVGMTQISEVRFYSSKADSLSKAALADAVRDARARAEIMADALGGSAGPLIELATESAARIGGRNVIEEERVQALSLKSGIVKVAPQEVMTKVVVVGRWEFMEAR